jgi:ABC-type cobalamin/Fe3+-siderophores transport system ATPase subunit
MHDLATVVRLADQAALLRGGGLVASGTPRDVLTPDRCRQVFAVETEVLTSADGRPVFVFGPTLSQGVH